MEVSLSLLLCGSLPNVFLWHELSWQVKFIVDGVWKVDPTRPIMYTKSGNENNVLIVKQ